MCVFCDFVCYSDNDINQHHTDKHNTEKMVDYRRKSKESKNNSRENEPCDLCKSSDLGEHKLGQHQERNYKCCLYCDFKSKGWVQLKCHIDGKHPEHYKGQKKHICEFCEKQFIFEESLKMHKKANHYKEMEKRELEMKKARQKRFHLQRQFMVCL